MHTHPPANRPLAAAASILGAMVIIGLIDNFVPRIAEEAGLWQFHAVRSGMVLIVLLIGAALFGWRLRPARPGRVAVRSALIAGAMAIYFASLAILPIGQVLAGLFTAPLWVLAFSALFLRRPFGVEHLVAAGLGFGGVLLVIGGGAMGDAVLLAAVPIVAGLFYALGQTATREWCATEAATALLFWFFFVMGVVALGGLTIVALLPENVQAEAPAAARFVLQPWVVPTPSFWFWTTVQSVGSLIGVGLIVRGYQLAEASRVSVYEYALLIFASLWAWILFGQEISAVAAFGMVLILASGGLMARAGRPRGAEPA